MYVNVVTAAATFQSDLSKINEMNEEEVDASQLILLAEVESPNTVCSCMLYELPVIHNFESGVSSWNVSA